jgi:hypothetical protein
MFAEGKTDKEIVEALGCTLAHVYVTRHDMKRKERMKRRMRAYEKAVKQEIKQEVKTDPLLLALRASTDNVNSPPHYTVGGIETYDFIVAKKLSYELGNVVKYVTRAGHKGKRLEDLQKARWYLDAAIKQESP